jgi:hypothetical protein
MHILFSKLDISDGFWRLIIQVADSYNFAGCGASGSSNGVG